MTFGATKRSDPETGKHYFYDEYGTPVSYANDGFPEPFTGALPQRQEEDPIPEDLVKAAGNFLVHEEFCIYPTGAEVQDIVYPDRVSATSEKIYWDGEKGSFIVLGGKKDAFKGYIIHTYAKNDSDSYIYLGWNNVSVNGVGIKPSSCTALRPHSSVYREIIIPAGFLYDNAIPDVEQVGFRVFAMGENLSIPLYPIEWKAAALTNLNK